MLSAWHNGELNHRRIVNNLASIAGKERQPQRGAWPGLSGLDRLR